MTQRENKKPVPDTLFLYMFLFSSFFSSFFSFLFFTAELSPPPCYLANNLPNYTRTHTIRERGSNGQLRHSCVGASVKVVLVFWPKYDAVRTAGTAGAPSRVVPLVPCAVHHRVFQAFLLATYMAVLYERPPSARLSRQPKWMSGTGEGGSPLVVNLERQL